MNESFMFYDGKGDLRMVMLESRLCDDFVCLFFS